MASQNSHETYQEMANLGFDFLKARQIELGNETRSLIEDYGFKSLAAEGFKSPTVVVSHTNRADFKNGSAFAGVGMQIAAVFPSNVVNRLTFKLSVLDCSVSINC